MNIPVEIISGITYIWTETSAEYPATDGWTCKLCPVGPTVVAAITAEINANLVDYDFVLTSVVTAGMLGIYECSFVVTKGEGAETEAHILGMVRVTVKYNPLEPGTYDGRSIAKKTLDAIEAVILNRASKDQQSYTIAGRSLIRSTPLELLALRKEYRKLYNKELRAEKIANGESPGRKIYVRFNGS